MICSPFQPLEKPSKISLSINLVLKCKHRLNIKGLLFYNLFWLDGFCFVFGQPTTDFTKPILAALIWQHRWRWPWTPDCPVSDSWVQRSQVSSTMLALWTFFQAQTRSHHSLNKTTLSLTCYTASSQHTCHLHEVPSPVHSPSTGTHPVSNSLPCTFPRHSDSDY